MLSITRARISALVAACAMSLAAAGTASAQTNQDGLVNVNLEDIVVQAPIGVAANLCDINANVLAEQLRAGGADCDADAKTTASNGPGNGGNTTQEGLVNVNIEDVTVQLPIAIAANVCDVNVNVLARQLRDGGAQCTADADSGAEN